MSAVGPLSQYLPKKCEPEEEPSIPPVKEEDEIEMFTRFLEGGVHQLSINVFLRAHYGENFISASVNATEALQQMRPFKPEPIKNTQCLKQNIADSTLSEKKDFTARKNGYAQCVQLGGPLAIPLCLQGHSKGLSASETKELTQLTPKVIVGREITKGMTPFAAISKVIKSVMKILYLGAVTEAAGQIDRQNFRETLKELRQTCEGQNPEFNKNLVESLPKWVLQAGHWIAAGDTKLQKFDEYMAEEYRTFPGIVHEGVHGVIDVVPVPALAVHGTVTLARIGANAIKTTARSIRDARQINQIVKTLYNEAMKGSVEVFTVKPGLKAVSDTIEIFNSETAFVNSLAVREMTQIELRNTSEVLPSVARGASKSSVFFAHNGDRTLPLVIKEFPSMRSPHSRFAKEILAYNILSDLKLRHLDLPQLLKVGKMFPPDNNLSGLLAMSRVPGKSLAETIELQTVLRGSELAAQIQENYRAAHAIGKALGELHSRSILKTAPSLMIMESHAGRVRTFYQKATAVLLEHGQTFSFNAHDLEKMITEFFRNPGKVGYAHGDAHFGNFIWDPAKKRVAAIDAGSLAELIDSTGKPIGIQAQDLAEITSMSRFIGKRAGMSETEVAELQFHFFEGYQTQSSLGSHTQEALRFYETYWNLFNLQHKHQTLESFFNTLKQINILIKTRRH